jgi:diadenosine tetraphosphate (Ap4A) HIT family hydrolase
MEGMMENCLFCKIIGGEIPAKRVFEDDKLVVIEDISPVAPVHVLIIPRKHVVNALDLDPADDELIGHVYRTSARLAREKGVAESGFRIVSNNNAGAGQSVFHIHFHLLAGRQLGWPPG